MIKFLKKLFRIKSSKPVVETPKVDDVIPVVETIIKEVISIVEPAIIETIEEAVQTEKPSSKPRGRKPSVKKEAVKLEVLKETAEPVVKKTRGRKPKAK